MRWKRFWRKNTILKSSSIFIWMRLRLKRDLVQAMKYSWHNFPSMKSYMDWWRRNCWKSILRPSSTRIPSIIKFLVGLKALKILISRKKTKNMLNWSWNRQKRGESKKNSTWNQWLTNPPGSSLAAPWARTTEANLSDIPILETLKNT